MIEVDPDLQPREPDVPLGELITRLSDQTSTLVRQEVQLAKAELQQDIRKAARAGGKAGAAVYAGHLFAITLVVGLGLLLGQALDGAWGLGLLIVSLVLALVAGGLALAARSTAEDLTPPLETTRERVPEDVRYIKERTK